MTWTKISDKEAYVKQSRAATGKYQISLNKGDKVIVKGESSGWSMVVLHHKGESIKGIFPTEFLQSSPPEKKEFKPQDPNDNSQDVVLNNEITQVLREW